MSLTSDIEGSWQDSPDHSLLHSGIDTGNEELTSGVLDGPSPAHAPSSHTLSCRHVAHRGGDCSPLSFISFAGIGRQFFFSSEVSEMWNRFYFYCPLISLFLFLGGGGVRGGSVNDCDSSSTGFLGCCAGFSFSSVGFPGSDTRIGAGAGLAFPLRMTSVHTCWSAVPFTGNPSLVAEFGRATARCPGCWQIQQSGFLSLTTI